MALATGLTDLHVTELDDRLTKGSSHSFYNTSSCVQFCDDVSLSSIFALRLALFTQPLVPADNALDHQLCFVSLETIWPTVDNIVTCVTR